MDDLERLPVSTWRLTASGFALVAVCYGLARFAYGWFVPTFRIEFALSGALLGTVGAGSYIGYCAATVVAALAVPRLGARQVALWAGAVAASGTAMVAVAPSAWLLAAAVLIAGSSTGLASPPLAEALGRWVPAARWNRAQAIVNSGPGAGIALSGPIALFLADQWRLAWVCFAGVALAVTIWIARVLPRPAVQPAALLGGDLGAVVRDPASRRLVLGATLFGVASACVWTFGRDHATRAGGLDDTTSAGLWIVLGVAELAGVAAGDLIDRISLRRAWQLALTVLATATALLGTAPSPTVAPFAAIAAFGGAYIALTIVVFVWAVTLHPDHHAAAVALGFFMIAIGQALGAPLAGALIDHASGTTAFLVSALLGILATASAPPVGLRAIPDGNSAQGRAQIGAEPHREQPRL